MNHEVFYAYFPHLPFVGLLSERDVLIVLIRLVPIYPTIWWRGVPHQMVGGGFFQPAFHAVIRTGAAR